MLIVWFFVYKKLAQFTVRCALPPRRSESPVCATDNKPSCVLHLLGWLIGSHGFSSLERRPEFWVLHRDPMTLPWQHDSFCHWRSCLFQQKSTRSQELSSTPHQIHLYPVVLSSVFLLLQWTIMIRRQRTNILLSAYYSKRISKCITWVNALNPHHNPVWWIHYHFYFADKEMEAQEGQIVWGFLLLFFCLAMRLPGSQFPDQGLKPGHSNESLES